MVSTSGSQGTKEFTAQRSHEVTSLRIAIYGAVSWEGKTDFFSGASSLGFCFNASCGF